MYMIKEVGKTFGSDAILHDNDNFCMTMFCMTITMNLQPHIDMNPLNGF